MRASRIILRRRTRAAASPARSQVPRVRRESRRWREVAALEEDEVDAGAERIDASDARVGVAEHALKLRQLLLLADDCERCIRVVAIRKASAEADVRVVA